MLRRPTSGVFPRLLLATVLLVAGTAASRAAPFLTFVAANGNDAGQCGLNAPCKTLQRAINVTAANGTVTILTPVQGNASVAKSITIVGEQVPFIGRIAISGANTVAKVQGLLMNGVGVVANGIYIASAKAVYIEDCTLERYTSDAIKLVATTPTKLFITNTIARGNASNGLYADALNAQVDIENSRFDGNGSTGLYLKVAKASVSNSSASGNLANGLATRTANLKINQSRADKNGTQGFMLFEGETYLRSLEGTGNGGFDLKLEGGISTQAIATGSLLGKVSNGGFLATLKDNFFLEFFGDPMSDFSPKD
jgi:hypothetical protein